jgi:hypothetical protein
MTAKLDYAWKLREVMATRGLFQTTRLRPRLAERGIVLSERTVRELMPVLSLCDQVDLWRYGRSGGLAAL